MLSYRQKNMEKKEKRKLKARPRLANQFGVTESEKNYRWKIEMYVHR